MLYVAIGMAISARLACGLYAAVLDRIDHPKPVIPGVDKWFVVFTVFAGVAGLIGFAMVREKGFRP